MRILTVRQPWAWAIIHSTKDVENRSRNIAGEYRGPVAIHAGQALDMDGMTDPNIVGAVAITRLFSGAGHPSTFKETGFGAIIGIADLTDVHPVEGCIEQQQDGDWLVCSMWAQRGGYHLVFENARALAKPIPYRGALGLRELPDDVAAMVLGGAA